MLHPKEVVELPVVLFRSQVTTHPLDAVSLHFPVGTRYGDLLVLICCPSGSAARIQCYDLHSPGLSSGRDGMSSASSIRSNHLWAPSLVLITTFISADL